MKTQPGVEERTARDIASCLVEAAKTAEVILAWAELECRVIPAAGVVREAFMAGLAGREMPETSNLAADHERRVWAEALGVLEGLATGG